ncbi:MAG TPA: glutamate ABC transporter substrate-binding protein [Phycicoccus sp.]|nr:glutamate ABC transporter substrate-binding protein [Phycicoccus sp.]
MTPPIGNKAPIGRIVTRGVIVPLLLAVALAVGACSGPTATVVPSASPTSSGASTSTASPSPSASAATCTNATASYAPDGPLPGPDALPSGSTMAAIKARGRLIVGVSADTYLLGSRNPLTGTIEGFDIDLATAIGEAILGPNPRIQLRVITATQRLPLLQAKEVDVVVRNMTMTCDRWTKIGFSAVYYQAGQKILARKGSAITDVASLAGHRVCAPTGTSSMDTLRRLAPTATAVPSDSHTGCLVLFQSGAVDAITGDDTVLAGLAAQDPYAVVTAAPAFTQEPYGVGVNAGSVDLAKFVNALLEKMRADGRWQHSYDRWLAPTLGAGTGQPAPTYGRTP